MFDELKIFRNCGHFFFTEENNLLTVSKDVPEEPGVYYVMRLAKGRIDLVYIGKSEPIYQGGTFKGQFLRSTLNNKQDGLEQEEFFKKKIAEENIDALDIYWFVTFDESNNSLPSYVEGQIMQSYFDIYGALPAWNKRF